MADAYYYSSAAQKMALSGSINGSTSTVVVDTVTGLPTSTPFKVVIDPGLSTEEIVKVTDVSGTTLTVVRGWDGSSGQAHGNLSEVRHMVTAEDLRLARGHEGASSGVHGVTGALVGVDDTQALSNKDLSSPTNTFPSALATDAEVGAAINSHAFSSNTHGVSGAIVGTDSSQTLTNKNLSSASNVFPSTLATADSVTAVSASSAAHAAATAAHGTAGAVVGTTDIQTLTNKSINGAVNTLTNIPRSALPLQVATGELALTFSGTSTQTQTITFPASRFSVAPIVTLTLRTTFSIVTATLAASPTTAGVSVKVSSTDGSPLTGNFYVQWIAIQE